MPSNKVIFGFTGLIASGKGTAAKYLEDAYGAATYRFSTMLRDVANRLYLEQSRDTLITLSEIIRNAFGEDTMARVIARDAANAAKEIVVVEGIRRMADIEHLRALPEFVLVNIVAEPRVRYARLIARGENSDDRTKTYDQFLADHERSTEMSIPEVASHATETIDNNGDTDALHRQLDALIKKYTSYAHTHPAN